MFYISLNSAKRFARTSVSVVAIELAIALLFLLNYTFLGRFQDPFPLAVFGLFGFFWNIVLNPVGFSIVDISGIKFAKRFGEQNFDKLINSFYKSLLTICLFLIIAITLCIFSYPVFLLVNVEPKLAADTSCLLKWSVIFAPFLFINKMLSTYLSSQGIVHEFTVINVVLSISSVFLCLFCTFELDMKQYGIIPAKIFQEFSLSICIAWLLIKKANPKTISYPIWRRIIRNYHLFLKKMSFSVIGTMLEFFTFEFNTVLAIQLQDINGLAVYMSWAGISFVIFTIGCGLSAALRLIVGLQIGERQILAARKEAISNIAYITIFSFACTVLLFSFSSNIAHFYMEEPQLAARLAQTIKIFAFLNWGYLLFYPIFQLFRLLDLDRYFMIATGTILFALNALLAITLCFFFKLGVPGIIAGHGLSITLIGIFFLRKLFFAYRWEDYNFDLKESLLTFEMSVKT